jgi:hypothetical protein
VLLPAPIIAATSTPAPAAAPAPAHTPAPGTSAPALYKATLVSPSDPLLPAVPAVEPRVSWSTTVPVPASIAPATISARHTLNSTAPLVIDVGTEAGPHVVPPTARRNAPALRQTIIAALAGPLLVAVAAAIMAVVLGTGPARAASTTATATMSAAATMPTAPAKAAEPEQLTAKSATVAPRTKAVVAATVSPKCARNPRSAACRAANR